MRMLRFAKVLVWSHTCATLAPLLTIGRTAPKGGNWSCFGSQSQSVFIRRTMSNLDAALRVQMRIELASCLTYKEGRS